MTAKKRQSSIIKSEVPCRWHKGDDPKADGEFLIYIQDQTAIYTDQGAFIRNENGGGGKWIFYRPPQCLNGTEKVVAWSKKPRPVFLEEWNERWNSKKG